MPYTAETKPGMGDPYWYEWSVGLKYIIDMLNTDNGIEYVELQANVPLGLDDVVVTYNSGEKLFVQVKHTRVEDTLTFGDLVSPEGGAKKSLLSVLAQSWDKVNGKYEHSKVMLFTNRTAGERAVKTRTRHPVHRPALSEFVPAMKQRISAVAVFNDVSFPEYEDAWAEWVQQLECIRSAEDKLTFLRAFEIVTNNPGLTELQEELIQKLKLTFQIDDEKADILLGRLDHALRIWATSSRETSKISAEEVYSRLSLSNEKISYNHDLLPTDPFFASRIPLLQSIEEEIAAGQHSIIFISGIPGTGKTNIVSKLCAKRDSYIDIRYYAYEPINPEKEYLPSDVSRRVDKEYFWNELFNQLRNIMRGQLFKYRVPVLNEFMAIEEKRKKFFEIAAAYAHDRGRDFIISIDGIDHAARATTFENTFLSTIPSPEYLPSNVKIILSGQPKKDYRNYPSWLLSADPEVIEICVPGIMPEDIRTLVDDKFPNKTEEYKTRLTELVSKYAEGNTLAAIFAVREALQQSDIIELERRLKERNLSGNIRNYYDVIWKNAVGTIGPLFIDYKVAGVFAFFNEPVDENKLHSIFAAESISVSGWRNILKSLQPLIEEKDGAYTVLHNDVRVFLSSVIGIDEDHVREVYSCLTDYYLNLTEKNEAFYRDIFRFMSGSNRLGEFERIYSPKFIIEAYVYGVELSDLFDISLSLLTEIKAKPMLNWHQFRVLSTGYMTLDQIEKSQYELGDDAFRVSNCSVEIRSIECFVETKDKWTSIVVADVLSFAVELIKHRLIERANALFKMWFSGITVGELCEIIDLQESENTLAVDTQELARNLGVCICYSGEYDMLKGIRSIIDDHHRFLTSMMDVVIENQLHELSNDSLKEALLSVEIINSEQLLKGLLTLLSENRINDISILSEVFGSRLMQTPNGILFSTFMDIVTSRFNAKTQEKDEIWKQIESLDFTGVPFENENAYYSIFAFVSAYLRPVSSFSAAHEIIELYYDKNPYRRDSIWGVFINNICMIGKWFSHYHSGDETCISAKELEKLMHPLFWEKWKPNVMNSELYALRPYLLKAYIFLSRTASEAVKTVINSVCQQAFANNPVDSMLDAGFYFYKDDIDRINQWYDDWLGEKGRAWNEALGERNRIIKHFLRALKLYDTNGCIRTAYAISKARWSVIGYVSHKEYTCDYLLKWYNGLVGKLGHALPNYAREIKSISDKTEQVGDNRIEHAINSRVYEDLFSCGYPTIVETLRDNWYLGQGIEMPEYLVDGLIGYLRDGTFSQEELIKIWSLGIALLDWKDDGNYDAIHSLQKAIELQTEKAGIKDIHETLIQYGQTYIDLVPDNERFEIPERWCDDHGTMRDELITDGILHDYMSGGEINKDVIGKGIEILSEKGRIEKSILVNLLEYELDHEEWGLEHNPIIAVLFKHLPAQDTNKYIVSFLDRILETKRSSLTTAVPTFARLALYQQEESYGRDGMDAIIQMHRDWLTAAGHFQQPELINQYDYKGIIEWDAVTDIFSLFYQIIQLIILSDDADAARVALSGLFALECIDEQFVYYIERDWNRYHYRAKEWLLMGYELLWNLCEERKGTILRCVEKHRTDSDFNVALYANLLFDSFSGKGGCSFAKKAQDYFSDIPSGRGQRLIISHSNSPWLTENEYAEKIISSLALFTGDDSLDIEEKTVAYLSCLKEEFSLIPLQRRKASWCKTVLYRAATAIFRILYKEWVNGRWAGREAQLARAILSASEPYMLFCSPKLWIGKGNKFIYDVGEYINKPDQIKKQELNKLFAYGLSENEVVLAGFLSEYSDKEELIGYQLTYFDFPWVSPSIVERQNEKNARFLLYKRCDFVGSSYPNISLYFSGIESFQNSKISCGISKTALSYFGWTIQLSQIGFILENKEAMPIGRLEQYFGYNDMRNRYPNNQPYLQRWVVRKDELFKNKGWKINSVVNTIIRPLT